jgi:hypothetical protein
MLFKLKASAAEYKAGLDLAIDRGWLELAITWFLAEREAFSRRSSILNYAAVLPQTTVTGNYSRAAG